MQIVNLKENVTLMSRLPQNQNIFYVRHHTVYFTRVCQRVYKMDITNAAASNFCQLILFNDRKLLKL